MRRTIIAILLLASTPTLAFEGSIYHCTVVDFRAVGPEGTYDEDRSAQNLASEFEVRELTDMFRVLTIRGNQYSNSKDYYVLSDGEYGASAVAPPFGYLETFTIARNRHSRSIAGIHASISRQLPSATESWFLSCRSDN